MKPLRRLTNPPAACAVAAAVARTARPRSGLGARPRSLPITPNGSTTNPAANTTSSATRAAASPDRTGQINVIQDYTHQVWATCSSNRRQSKAILVTPSAFPTRTRRTRPSDNHAADSASKEQAQRWTKALPCTYQLGRTRTSSRRCLRRSGRAAITPNLRAHETNTPITSTAQPAVSNSIRTDTRSIRKRIRQLQQPRQQFPPTAPMKPTEKCSSTMPSSTAGATAWSLSTSARRLRFNPFISAGASGHRRHTVRNALCHRQKPQCATSPLARRGQIAVIGGLGSVAGFEKNTREAVDRGYRKTPMPPKPSKPWSTSCRLPKSKT